MKGNRWLAIVLGVAAMSIAHRTWAQPSVDDVLAALDFSAADKQRILNGEFVGGDLKAVSDRDLSVSMGFLVKIPPEDLAQKVLAGSLSKDPQLTARGDIEGSGSLEDFAGVQLVPGGASVADAYINASGGDKLNLDGSEIAAFKALKGQGDPVKAVEQQLRAMLLARYKAYHASGLQGIAPYDRGGGKKAEAASDLRKASEAPLLKKFVPHIQAVLLGYPKATTPGMSENFFWVNNKIEDQPTYALTHIMVASEGAVRIVIQRQYYASRSYNAEQAIVGFFPEPQGTLVVYTNHTFTDQVGGFGSSAKQSIGRRMMGSTLKELFEKQRAAAAKP
jgi:hypothetical protein